MWFADGDGSDYYREAVRKCYAKTPIRPALDNGDIIYYACLRSESDSIEKFQREAVLVCTGAFRIASNYRLLKELGWQKNGNL